jgi:hypothetical protein
MSVRTYPEWFIDGPWHGEDKRKKCPHLQGMIRCALPRAFTYQDFIQEPDPSTLIEPSFDEYVYVPKYVDVFGERLVVWTGERNVGIRTRPGDEQPDWVRMLGQLILAPHRIEDGQSTFDVRSLARNHQMRWDIEHEVRRDLDRQYRERIRVLEQQLHYARVSIRDTRTASGESRWHGNCTATIDFTDDEGIRSVIQFRNIVLYFDEGDGTDESPPSWIATAQGPENASSDHLTPCTGYGTTKKAAIVALLADGIGVYTRAIEIGERMR